MNPRKRDENEDGNPNYDPMPHMAAGGEVGDDEQMTLAQPPPMQSIQPPAEEAPPTPSPARPLPGMPPHVTPDALQQFLAQQKAGFAKYGPEQQIAQQEALNRQRSGLVPTLARATGGFADALMQGVARAGPSNFEANITNQQNKLAGETMDTMRNAQAGKSAQMQQEMKLSMDDPKSAISGVAQKSEAQTLLKLGWTDDQIKQASANTIGEATKNGLGYFEAKAKADEAKALHEMQAGTAAASLKQIHEHQTAEEKAAADALALRKKENEISHPFATGIHDLLNPDTTAQAPTGPLGATTIKNGKTYEWSPSTGKYHLKQ